MFHGEDLLVLCEFHCVYSGSYACIYGGAGIVLQYRGVVQNLDFGARCIVLCGRA